MCPEMFENLNKNYPPSSPDGNPVWLKNDTTVTVDTLATYVDNKL